MILTLVCHQLPFGYTKLKELDSFSYLKKSKILSPAYLSYQQKLNLHQDYKTRLFKTIFSAIKIREDVP